VTVAEEEVTVAEEEVTVAEEEVTVAEEGTPADMEEEDERLMALLNETVES
jgi:hypothetical protein